MLAEISQSAPQSRCLLGSDRNKKKRLRSLIFYTYDISNSNRQRAGSCVDKPKSQRTHQTRSANRFTFFCIAWNLYRYQHRIDDTATVTTTSLCFVARGRAVRQSRTRFDIKRMVDALLTNGLSPSHALGLRSPQLLKPASEISDRFGLR